METTPVRSYSKKQLSEMYGISVNTFKNWLKRAGIYDSMQFDKMLTPQKVKLIFDKLGSPEG